MLGRTNPDFQAKIEDYKKERMMEQRHGIFGFAFKSYPPWDGHTSGAGQRHILCILEALKKKNK